MKRSILLAAGLLFAAAAAHAEPRYDVKIYPLPADGKGDPLIEFANFINEKGVVVGFHHHWDAAQARARAETPAVLDHGRIHPVTETLGGDQVQAYAINAAGKFVGVSATATGDQHAYLFDGHMHDLGAMGQKASHAWSLNDKDVVVGMTFDNQVAFSGRAFIYSDGVMRDLNTVAPANPALFGGAAYTLANAMAINNRGDILLRGFTADHRSALLLYADGVVTEPDKAFQDTQKIDTQPGARLREDGSFAVQGASSDGKPQAYLYAGGVFRPVGSKGVASLGFDADAHGEVVGAALPAGATASRPDTDPNFAILMRKDETFDLNKLVPADKLSVDGARYRLVLATSINDAGVIVGVAQDPALPGDDHRAKAVFVATPAGESSPFLLWLMAAAVAVAALAAGYAIWRRRKA